MTSDRLVCTGCGSEITDAELVELRKRDDRVLSCCPERKMWKLEPHAYAPSIMHMGDCSICGHLQSAAIHSQADA